MKLYMTYMLIYMLCQAYFFCSMYRLYSAHVAYRVLKLHKLNKTFAQSKIAFPQLSKMVPQKKKRKQNSKNEWRLKFIIFHAHHVASSLAVAPSSVSCTCWVDTQVFKRVIDIYVVRTCTICTIFMLGIYRYMCYVHIFPSHKNNG